MNTKIRSATGAAFFIFSCIVFTLALRPAEASRPKPPTGAGVPAELGALPNSQKVPDGLAPSDWSSIRAAYEAGRHRVSAVEMGGHQARNPGQQWLTKFDGRGFLTQPDAGGWQWGLELRSYGFPGEEHAINGQPEVKAEGQRIIYRWDATVQEWFVNDQRGLEHGFTIKQRPAGADNPQPATRNPQLSFTLAVRGDLRPDVSSDGATVRFVDAQGKAALTYTGLKVWDAEGKALPAKFSPAGTGLRLSVDERGARYPLTIDPIAQQAYLKASNTGAGDEYGISVAVAGDTVVIGSWGEDSNATGVNGDGNNNSAPAAGAAYVFVRSGTTWTQQAYLKASNTGAGDQFGVSVALSGDTLVVGASREDSSVTGVNGDQSNNNTSNSGAAYVFVRSGTTWTQQAYLKASNTGADDYFGGSVAVAGDTVVVTAAGEDSSATDVNGDGSNNSAIDSGAAYVFVRSESTWTQQAYLKASNTGANDYLGASLAIAGDMVVIGAWGEDSNATGVNGDQLDNSASYSGAAYVFVRSGTTWIQQAYLKASNTGADDFFGYSVAVSGDTVVVGASQESSSATGVNGDQLDNSVLYSGAAYIFVRSGTTWTQQAYLKASNTGQFDKFGYSVAVSGDAVVAGAFQESSNATGVNGDQANNNASRSGAAYVFMRSGTTWSQQAYLKASNTEANDQFGNSVAVAGDTVVVGAYREDSNAIGINGDGSNNSAQDSGAAYVFTELVLPDSDSDGDPDATDCAPLNPAVHHGATEVCNGIDDDCDPLTADGSGDPEVGQSCDGPDADQCTEGTTECTGGSLSCSDTTGDNADICNGFDDDCNPATADGSGDPAVGQSCDGPDADQCTEGTTQCTGGSLSCSDATGDNTETCNGIDDDCDGQTDETCTPAQGGSFVIGDGNAVIGSKVTFWSAQWSKRNTVSGGAAPGAFKGFANMTSTNPPSCGGTWEASSKNDPAPPASVPPFMVVIVTSEMTKSGPVISGNIPQTVVIETDPGYGSSPGRDGTGTVVAINCQSAP